MIKPRVKVPVTTHKLFLTFIFQFKSKINMQNQQNAQAGAVPGAVPQAQGAAAAAPQLPQCRLMLTSFGWMRKKGYYMSCSAVFITSLLVSTQL